MYPAKFTIDGAVIKSAQYDDDKTRGYHHTGQNPLPRANTGVTARKNLVMGNGEIYAEKLFADFGKGK